MAINDSVVCPIPLGVRVSWLAVSLCLSVRIQKLPRLLVASSDGQLFIYNVDPQDGGECVLAQKHR